jgi:hypothetical protein
MVTPIGRHCHELFRGAKSDFNKMSAVVLTFLLISAGCGGGSYNGPYPPDASGAYTFYLSGYPCGPTCKPLISLGFSQTSWSGNTNKLEFGTIWSIYNFCWTSPPQTSAFTFNGHLTASSAQNETLTMVIEVNGQDFVTLTSSTSSMLSGTWTAGSALTACSAFNGPLTWTAQKGPGS